MNVLFYISVIVFLICVLIKTRIDSTSIVSMKCKVDPNAANPYVESNINVTDKVYINKTNKDGIIIGRKLVGVEKTKENVKTLLSKLPDKHIIKRKKKRDLPKEGS